jgi:hypothetical protein
VHRVFGWGPFLPHLQSALGNLVIFAIAWALS